MNKLKVATIKDFKSWDIPADDLKNISKNSKSARYILASSAPMKKKDDSLIDIEIAFRKCKRVGVFD